jgi:hypothetical protein
MQSLFAKPKAVYTVLVVLMVGLFSMSFVGNTGPEEKQPDSGPEYLTGAIGWFGFLLAMVATLLFTIALGAHRLLRRRHAPA